MMFKKKYILFCLIVFSINIFSQENSIKMPLYLNFDLSSKLIALEQKLIKKSTFEAILSTKEFELRLNSFDSLGDLDTSKKPKILIMAKILNKDESLYEIDLELINLANKKLINKKVKESVSSRKLQLTYRKLLYQLLYEENFDENSNKLRNSNTIDLFHPRPNIDQSKSLWKGNLLEKEKSSGVNDQNEKSKDDLPLKEEIEKKKTLRQNHKKNITISDFSSPDIVPEQEKSIVEEEKFKRKWKSKSSLYLGYEAERIKSSALIEVTENNQLLSIGGNMNLFKEGEPNYFSLNGKFSKVSTDNRLDKAPVFEFGGKYNSNVFNQDVFLAGGLDFESSNFINVASEESGAAVWTNSYLWMTFETRFLTYFYKKKTQFKMLLKMLFVGSSDLDSSSKVKLSGTHFAFMGRRSLYKKFMGELRFEVREITAANFDGLKIIHQTVGYFILYEF